MAYRVVAALSSAFLLLPSCIAQQADPPTILVFDASSSMLQQDADGTRIDAAKSAATELITSMPSNTELGIVAYGTNIGDSDADKERSCKDVSLIRSLEKITDGSAAQKTVEAITPKGWTPLASAIEKAANQLPADREANIVVLSDGLDTCDGDLKQLTKTITTTHPKLRVDAVTFKEDAEHLEDLTAATGGISVTADNSAQLTKRLGAFRDSERRDTLNGNGINGINLGESVEEIRDNHDNFPTTTCSEKTCVISFEDCDYIFIDGKLQAIEPKNASTIDGIAVGDSIDSAITIWGDPSEKKEIDGGSLEYYFPVGSQNSWKVTVKDGNITQIVLCRCQENGDAASSTGNNSGFQLKKEANGIRVGSKISDYQGGIIATNGLPIMGKYVAVGISVDGYENSDTLNGALVFAENTEDSRDDAKINYILPFNKPGALYFKNQDEADAYFGKAVKDGVANNMPYAYYATSDPKVFFLVQWLPGGQSLIEITPVKSVNDWAEDQPLTANGRYAMGFGRVASYDMSLKESSLSNPKKMNYCTSYEITPDGHAALFVKGKLVGFMAGMRDSTGFITTARGVGFGDTVEDVRKAYPDLKVTDTGLEVMTPYIIVESPNNPDIFLSFGYEADGRITTMRTGTKEFTEFWEMCSSSA